MSLVSSCLYTLFSWSNSFSSLRSDHDSDCQQPEENKPSERSEFLVVLADHGVQLFVFTLGALCYELLLLLLQVLQLPLQAFQVKHSAVPQQAARERVHVAEGNAGQPPAGPNSSV